MKGQVAFLEAVRPRLLEGYRLVFYSGENSVATRAVSDALLSVAMARGLNVEVHLDPVPLEELLSRACSAAGVIQFSMRDENPRVVYELLYAGLPVFVTREARTPDALNEQPFVRVVDYVDGVRSSAHQRHVMNRELHAFLALTREATVRGAMEVFLRDAMRPEDIYARVCVQMGLCLPSDAVVAISS
jgi:hypothetical protein